MKILLAGASSLIGSEVRRQARGEHELRVLVRRVARTDDEHSWDPAARTVPAEALQWADAVISLSGAGLARLPWTRGYREEILRSRIDTTATIAQGIAQSDAPPEAWVSASAVGIYGDRPGETLLDDSGRGRGFLADVVAAWEQATEPARGRTRVVHARTGLVLARGGALKPLMLATRFGLGASVSNGEQYWPWIGLADEARALLHLATASAVEGPVNLVGPEPARSKDITTALARALHRPHLLRLPRFALKTAMGLAADELLLADQRAESRVLLGDGFMFTTPTVQEALEPVVRG